VDQGDASRRGSGHSVRVQDRRDRLNAVDKPRAWPYHQGVRVDRPHRNAGQRRRHGGGLGHRARQVETAWRDDDQVGVGGGDFRPGELFGASPAAGRDRLAARRGHQVRDPVPGRERRVHPLDDRDPGPRAARDARRHAGEAIAQASDDPRRAVPGSGPLADGEDRAEDLIKGVRVEGQHVGAAPQVVQCLRHVPGRQRADPAQVLRQDQVGPQPGECVRVQRVQVLAARELVADVAVDLRRGHPRRVAAAHHHFLLRAGGRRLIALERNPDEVAAQAERVHDLGRGRQQGHKAHAASVPIDGPAASPARDSTPAGMGAQIQLSAAGASVPWASRREMTGLRRAWPAFIRGAGASGGRLTGRWPLPRWRPPAPSRR
jgi:hypothetical protein